MDSGFQTHVLNDGLEFLTGRIPEDLRASIPFGTLWDLHPSEFPEIQMHGRWVKIPRWQQAYGRAYRFSGQTSHPLPVPAILEPVLAWCRTAIDPRLKGLLLNSYAGQVRQYIGRHRDSNHNLVPKSPIVTVSFGEERVFRLRPWPHQPDAAPSDFRTADGSVFILP